MKKARLLNFVSLILIIALLSACGRQPDPAAEATTTPTPTEAPTPDPTETPTPNPTETPTPEPTEEPTPEPTQEPTPTQEGPYTWEGTTVDDDDMYKKPYLTVENMNIQMESGPITATITGMQLSTIVFHDEYYAEIAELEPEQEGTMVTLDFTFENTTDDHVNFYDFAVITTNTKEQVGASAFGDLFDSNYRGNVKQSGMLVFFLQNSDPASITEINVFLDPPIDPETFDDLGEELRCTINTLEYGELA